MRRSQVCFRGQTGKHSLSLSFTGCDPKRLGGAFFVAMQAADPLQTCYS
jgi:hypothetical protein